MGIVFWVFLVASLATVYGPRLFLMHDEELPGEDLMKRNPSLAWIGKRYPLLLDLWCLFTALIYTAIGVWFKDRVGNQIYLAVTAWLVSIAVFDGSIAFRTGVYPVPTRGKCRYVYEDGVRLRRIGLLQIFFAIVVIVVILLLIFVAPPK
jgi:hypothetical protein